MYTLCSAWMPWWCVCYSPAQSWFHFSPAPKTGHIRSMDGLPLWFPNLFFSGKSSPHLNTDKLCLIWCVSALRTYLKSERQWDWGWIEWTGEYLAVGQKRLNNKKSGSSVCQFELQNIFNEASPIKYSSWSSSCSSWSSSSPSWSAWKMWIVKGIDRGWSRHLRPVAGNYSNAARQKWKPTFLWILPLDWILLKVFTFYKHALVVPPPSLLVLLMLAWLHTKLWKELSFLCIHLHTMCSPHMLQTKRTPHWSMHRALYIFHTAYTTCHTTYSSVDPPSPLCTHTLYDEDICADFFVGGIINSASDDIHIYHARKPCPLPKLEPPPPFHPRLVVVSSCTLCYQASQGTLGELAF